MLRTLVIVLAVLNGVHGLNPLTSSDCDLCKDLVGSGDTQKIIHAACKVVQAKDEIVDAEWKLHSSAMLAKDTEGEILKQIRGLSDSGVSPEVICGFMGVQSYQGGCVCPSDLTQFDTLGETLRALSSDRSGTSESEVESTLNCAPRDSVSLLELGRRTRMKKRRKASAKASMMMTFEGCNGDRGKDKKKDDTVGKVVKEIRPESDRMQRRADQATGLVMSAIGAGIGLACPPCGIAFRVIWGLFDYMLSEFSDEYERAICKDIMEKAHRALSLKLPVVSRTAEMMSVWDLMRASPKWDKYVEAASALVNGAYVVGRETPVPDPLRRSKIKSTVSFILNVAPIPSIGHAAHLTEGTAAAVEAAQILGESLFDEALQSLLSDRQAYRTTTVLYLLQAFYGEALLRESSPEVKLHDPEGHYKYFLNMDVFHEYLVCKLVFKLNSKRGTRGCHGLDIACGMAGRPGKVAGCPDEYKKLVQAFKEAQTDFVERYIRVDPERDARLRGGSGVESAGDEKRRSRFPVANRKGPSHP